MDKSETEALECELFDGARFQWTGYRELRDDPVAETRKSVEPACAHLGGIAGAPSLRARALVTPPG